MIKCTNVQEVIVEKGPEGLRVNAEFREHITDCTACFEFLEASNQLDRELTELPSFDAPRSVIENTLNEIRDQASQPGESHQTLTPKKGIRNAAHWFWLGFKRPTVLSTMVLATLLFFFIFLPKQFNQTGFSQKSDTNGFSPGSELERPSGARQELPGTTEKNTVILKDELKKKRDTTLSESVNSVDAISGEHIPEKIPVMPMRNLKQKGKKEIPARKNNMEEGKSVPSSPLSHSRWDSDKDVDQQASGNGYDGPQASFLVVGADKEKKVPEKTQEPLVEFESIEELSVGRVEERSKTPGVSKDVIASDDAQTPAGANGTESSYIIDGMKTTDNENMAENELDDWEIGIPEAPPEKTKEGDTIARVGQVGVEPPVFTKKVRPEYPSKAFKAKIQGYVLLEANLRKDGTIDNIVVTSPLGQGEFGFEEKAVEALKKWRFLPGRVNDRTSDVKMVLKIDFRLDEQWDDPNLINEFQKKAEFLQSLEQQQALAEFHEKYRSSTDLSFQNPIGYWANTYVPGDPVVRLLQARCAKFDRSDLVQKTGNILGLKKHVKPNHQPFDIPKHSALGLYCSSSYQKITDPTRMTLQVGIKATARSSGHRPPLNLGIILDLRGKQGPEEVALFKSVLDSFAKQRDITDNFHLIIAGKPGGIMLTPDQFIHGHLLVAKSELFDGKANDGPVFSLEEALTAAKKAVQHSNQPSSHLGSSTTILVTSQMLSDMKTLEAIAHRHAVTGIQLSLMGIGDAIDMDQLDRLTLAGQGSRRFIHSKAEAQMAVEKEITAVSQVVARALRLRIKLGPNMKLVDVLGSYNLDVLASERVRRAEKSVDQRLSKSLGIEADRGEDEEGIQIVIPKFFAGDTHVILLDVLAESPGLALETTLRYKDLVFIKNGIARSTLQLGAGDPIADPLNISVHKNLLAYHLSETLISAGKELSEGDELSARVRLTKNMDLIEAMKRSVPLYANDPDIQNDLELLGEYLSMIQNISILNAEQRTYLIETMVLSGTMKILSISNWE